MSDVTRILKSIEEGGPESSRQLLPVVYEELRKLAAFKLAQEKPGHTLQPTALVHEAYMRLVNGNESAGWDSSGHFFAAAAEAMRRILVESARRKSRIKHGGELKRVELNDFDLPVRPPPEEILALDAALTRLEAEDAAAGQVVRLHVFGGLSLEEAAPVMGISRATAYRHWTYARAWLRCEIGEGSDLPQW